MVSEKRVQKLRKKYSTLFQLEDVKVFYLTDKIACFSKTMGLCPNFGWHFALLNQYYQIIKGKLMQI